MRTSASLASAIMLADAAAQGGNETMTLCFDPEPSAFVILTTHEYACLLEGQAKPVFQPVLSIYPDGRVDLYRQVVLPKEVSGVR